MLDTLTESLPAGHEHVDAPRADVCAFTAFPKELWRQVSSNNPNHRLNKEIRGRTDDVGIFPDRDAVTVWSAPCSPNNTTNGRRPPYLGLDLLARAQAVTTETTTGSELPELEAAARHPPTP